MRENMAIHIWGSTFPEKTAPHSGTSMPSSVRGAAIGPFPYFTRTGCTESLSVLAVAENFPGGTSNFSGIRASSQ